VFSTTFLIQWLFYLKNAEREKNVLAMQAGYTAKYRPESSNQISFQKQIDKPQ